MTVFGRFCYVAEPVRHGFYGWVPLRVVGVIGFEPRPAFSHVGTAQQATLNKTCAEPVRGTEYDSAFQNRQGASLPLHLGTSPPIPALKREGAGGPRPSPHRNKLAGRRHGPTYSQPTAFFSRIETRVLPPPGALSGNLSHMAG